MSRSDKVGQQQPDDEASDESAGDSPGATLAAALRMLGRRSYTAAEMRERLARRADAPSVAAALERLAELRLIDDAAWAERFAAERFERAGRGRHRILSELVGRGIDAELAADVVARVVDPARERDHAREQLGRLLGRGFGAARPCEAGARPAPGERGSGGGERCEADPDSGGAGRRETGPDPEASERCEPGERERASAFRRLVARGFPASLVRDLLSGS